MSPASGAGETVPILGASGGVRCLHLSSTKHKWRLGEAGLSGAIKTWRGDAPFGRVTNLNRDSKEFSINYL